MAEAWKRGLELATGRDDEEGSREKRRSAVKAMAAAVVDRRQRSPMIMRGGAHDG